MGDGRRSRAAADVRGPHGVGGRTSPWRAVWRRCLSGGLVVGLLAACAPSVPEVADDAGDAAAPAAGATPGSTAGEGDAAGATAAPTEHAASASPSAGAPDDGTSPQGGDEPAGDGPGFVGALVPSSDGTAGDRFGSDVDTDGQTVVAGAPGRDDDRGAAVVLRRFQEGLQQYAVLEPPQGTPPGSGFGLAVAVDGDVLAVTAPLGDQPTLYVYERRDEDWGLAFSQPAPDDAPAGFGLDVAVDSATVVVGAPADTGPSTGRAYVYAPPQGGPWGLFGELRPPSEDADRRFGASVAIDEANVVVGAPSRTGGTGAVHVYDYAAGYRHAATLTPQDQRPGSLFGASVAVSVVPDAFRVAVLVGAPDHDEAGEQAGTTYRYDRDEQGAWRQSTMAGTHAPADLLAGARFGTDVAIDGPATSVVGAATAGDEAGFIEIGLPDAVEVLEAPHGAGRVFGGSVAVADGFVVAGAPRAFGDAGGVYVIDDEAVRAVAGD